MISLQKIAKEAKLSIGTVSQVLNKADTRYSLKTREHIKKIAKKYGYRPNRLVQSILSGKTKSIGLVVHTLTSQTVTGYVEFLAKIMRDEGYQMFIIESADASMDREREAIEDLLARRVDGLVILVQAHSPTSYYDALYVEKIPLVLVGYHPKTKNLPWVYIDSELGTYLAVRHLLDLGHRRIAFTPCQYAASLPGGRLAGYQRGLKEAGIEYDPHLVLTDLPTAVEPICEFTRARLNEEAPPTAFIYNDDEMALAGMQTMLEMGLKIPEDVSVVGYNNSPFAQYVSPPLTTIRQPLTEMARITANFLLKNINGTLPRERHIIPIKPSILIRKSTGPVGRHSRSL